MPEPFLSPARHRETELAQARRAGPLSPSAVHGVARDLSLSPGGPVSRGAQAILQSMIKKILSILSDKIRLCGFESPARHQLRFRRWQAGL